MNMKMPMRSIAAAVILGALATTSSVRAQDQSQQSGQDLDKLVAPIALYPDALVIQVLQCAQSPYQVKQVSDWLKKNPDLKGTAAQDGAKKQGFDASFIAIVLFPDVLFKMDDDMDWTKALGQAFATEKDAVFAAVQKLRKEAKKMGNLESNKQQKVETQTTDSGQQVIVIQPANPQVVYVPEYNPQVVYTQPAPSSSGHAVAAGLIGFTAGVIVGAAADNDHHNYYYHYGGWGYHGSLCCSSGWNNYYDHREDMANDWQSWSRNNQSQRQDRMSDNQSQRQDWADNRQDQRSDNLQNAQGQRSQNVSDRQGQRSQNQATLQDSRSQLQSSRSDRQSTWQSDRGSSSSLGGFQGMSGSSPRASGMDSGAFSGYQRGSSERSSSSRGRSSMGGRGGFDRGGGGGFRGGGGRRR